MADRERIAFDLHDLVIQRLFAAGLALKSTANITVDPQLAHRLTRVIDELDGTIVDIRTTVLLSDTDTRAPQGTCAARYSTSSATPPAPWDTIPGCASGGLSPPRCLTS